MTEKTVLFMCPHGAAKSVLAAAYFGRMTVELEHSWRISNAGTEPDEVLATAVVGLLRQEDLDVPDGKPHRVTEAELAAADWVVSMGCDLSGFDVGDTAVVHWDEVPPPSQGLLAAKEAIIQQLEDFLNQLTE